MENCFIFVEGVADVIFLRDYILFLDSEFKDIDSDKKSKNCKKVILKKNDEKKIDISAVGGYTKIKDVLKTRRKEISESGGRVVVIQDADDPTKNDGGFVIRSKYLDDTEDVFSMFLFPNNKDDGDLETLLEVIANKEKFEKSNSCYESYAECVGRINSEAKKELLASKNIIFSYIATYLGMESAKECNRRYGSTYWNFGNEVLEPLKDFLSKDVL